MNPAAADRTVPCPPMPRPAGTPSDAWYCLRSRPKQEHIASANLRRLLRIEVFHPRLRLRKATTRGPVWFTEPFFPGYLFACFEPAGLAEKVRRTFGVVDVVHFGPRWPVVPEDVIRDLQAIFGGVEIYDLPRAFRPGEEVRIAEGSFAGLTAVVHRYAPASQRVQVLLDFLGHGTVLELDTRSLAAKTHYPELLCTKPEGTPRAGARCTIPCEPGPDPAAWNRGLRRADA